MRYAIISDIHSNLEALTAVLGACRQQKVDAIYCVGDVVGYAADPGACVELIGRTATGCVAGNHDWAVVGRLDASYFNEWGKAGIAYSRRKLSFEHITYLSELPLTQKTDDFILAHGTLHTPEQFVYMNDITETADTFYAMDRPVCFVGHTHVPNIIIRRGERVCYAPSLEIEVDPECKYIINVGSVGQPRDGVPLAAYCLYDTVNGFIEIMRVPYAIETVQAKIFAAGLPDFLAHRLKMGQ